MNLKSKKIIISRHVFYEEKFLAAEPTAPKESYNFLDNLDEPSPVLRSLLQTPLPSTHAPIINQPQI